MRQMKHPDMDDIVLTDIMYALSDPTRLEIVCRLSDGSALTCGELNGDRPKSSMSHHFKILREFGVIKTQPRGKEHLNMLRQSELDQKFPGLIDAIISASH